jgi:hypothetical protein
VFSITGFVPPKKLRIFAGLLELLLVLLEICSTFLITPKVSFLSNPVEYLCGVGKPVAITVTFISPGGRVNVKREKYTLKNPDTIIDSFNSNEYLEVIYS